MHLEGATSHSHHGLCGVIAISGHCARERVIGFENLLLFTAEGRTFAVVGESDSFYACGVFLVISHQDYEAFAEAYVHRASGEGARR